MFDFEIGFGGFVIALLILAIAILFSGIKTVPQGFRYTVERFGKFTRTLHPGLHIIVPIVDRVGHKVNVMEQVLDIKRQVIITHFSPVKTKKIPEE